MAGFDAGSIVEPMDWDFTQYCGKNAKGTVPEPSDLEVEKFLKRWRILTVQVMTSAEAQANRELEAEQAARNALLKAGAPEETVQIPTLAEALEMMKSVDLTVTSPEIADAMADLVAGFCKNKPTKAQILKLPNRVRGAFYGWLIGQVTNPEFSAAVTKPTLSLVNGG